MDTGTIGITVLIVILLNILYDVFLHTIWPRWLAPKPDIKYDADHYFISDTQAGHDFVIYNNGRGTARQLDFYVEFRAPFKIITSTGLPQPKRETEGPEKSSWNAYWDTLAPKNFISVRIISEANKKDPTSVFPLETKFSDKDRIHNRIYAPPQA